VRLISSIIIGGTLAAMTACAAPPAASPEAPAADPQGSQPPAWRCDAEGARSLIGSHVGAVTFPRNSNVRIACTTCPVTHDYQEDRLNLFFDQETGIIERVTCG
jgi:hypothetical protein